MRKEERRNPVKTETPMNQVVEKLLRKIETILDEAETLDSQAVRQLTASLKDLKDIQQKETKDDRDTGSLRVILEGELEQYGK